MPAWLVESLTAIKEKLQALGSKELERYLLREQPDALLESLGLDDEAIRFRAHLDLIQQKLVEHPNLETELQKHALMRDYLRISAREIEKDIVAEEIAHDVPIRWVDRKKPPYKDQPWAWLRRPDLFVVHVYGRWLKTLKLKHLAQDRSLYNAYIAMLRRHPERDLNLPQETRESYEQDEVVAGPRPGYLRIPTAQLSEEEKKHRRALDAQQKRAYRARTGRR